MTENKQAATLAANVARRIVDRLVQHGVRGKRRDELALELAIGALMAVNSLSERPEGAAELQEMAIKICHHGFAEAERWAANAPPVAYTAA